MRMKKKTINLQSYTFRNPANRNYPEIDRTFLHDPEADELYICWMVEGDVIRALADGTPVPPKDGQPFFPLSWLKRHYPPALFQGAEKKMRMAIAYARQGAH